MPKIEMKCTHQFKEKALDHVGKNQIKYRSLSHFVQEALLERMEKDEANSGVKTSG